MIKIYKNKYGELTLSLGSIKNVKEAYIKDCVNNYALEELEKVVLITENKNIQIAFSKNLNYGAIFFHESTAMVREGKIEHIAFLSKVIPSQEIDRLRERTLNAIN